jgi:formate dehydrogenase subunit gamma
MTFKAKFCALTLLVLTASGLLPLTGASAQTPAPPAPAPEASSSVRPPASAVVPGGPGMVQPEKPGNYDVEMWKKVRGGLNGSVSIPDKKSGTLVQSGGEDWRNFRNGPLPTYGAYAMLGMLGLLIAFYLVRGRINIEHGWANETIQRFTNLDRMGHWLMATSFIILALTGLNVLYGKYVLLPVIGKDAFAALSGLAKWMHNYVAFAFMLGLAISFVMWVKHNFPNKHDVVWLARLGGAIGNGHPSAKKFNAGQKILFWLVMLGGLSISLSGLALMFPFQSSMFAKTFGWLNMIGFSFPTAMTPMQEMQYASSWHAIMALFLVVVIFGHIYIGTLGMQGAFSAMGSGEVDVNWAKEHHNLWADEELAKRGRAPVQPAE